jgi:membrane protein involved in colicin uptake
MTALAQAEVGNNCHQLGEDGHIMKKRSAKKVARKTEKKATKNVAKKTTKKGAKKAAKKTVKKKSFGGGTGGEGPETGEGWGGETGWISSGMKPKQPGTSGGWGGETGGKLYGPGTTGGWSITDGGP